jgi:predicted amidohydrolase YtcJ
MKKSNVPADLILYNARVITLEPEQPNAELIAIKGNKILDTGTNDDIAFFKGTKTGLVDCQGKTVVSGFNDAHCHPRGFAASMLSVDCRPPLVGSIVELKALISQRAAQTPKGRWVRAMNYNEYYLSEKRHPNRRDLDEAAPDHPVRLYHRSGHACVLNSLALKMAGISRETPEPPGGIIERDLETGEPNGMLYGMNPFIEKVVPVLAEDELGIAYRLADQEYLSNGITSLQDAYRVGGLERWQMYQQLKERGDIKVRISMMVGAEAVGELQGRGLSMGSGNSQLRLGGAKIILQTVTGSMDPPREELNRLVYEAHKAGFQLAIHAVEMDTLEAAIIALERALHQLPKPGHRHRIEHCSVCPPHLMQRLKGIGLMVVTQPSFIYYNGERYLAKVSQNDRKWLYPIGSLLRNGIKVAGSSDSPIVPPNPLVGIYAAVTRKAETGQVVLPQESISSLEALKMYTISAAYSSFEERSKGSIVPGKLADLVILSDDPTNVEPEEIKEIQVLTTIIDGKVVWERK